MNTRSFRKKTHHKSHILKQFKNVYSYVYYTQQP